mmetsp:Transcript_8831/g.20428  ORF Transcript_8831/g.20428 Transcript_8831/m.20428 type:complete len:305 (-) Transcript_8831:209-1123(-)|eukprot:CAMPEP_0116844350 /NCGR_PEP_ID=MMETSP0418-20121206/12620_1 /TAXON_ID=1158023 /ORGANISM="Astrosyne radiata, Strain 13vi08-1A" /LENGTH=304 /DNA_ID=CAMNT_0004475255 /DNA_START=53 /DNA_END=967 /DNA_ORIENTATION=-
MSFSLSAPVFTNEEESVELAALTEEEKEEIHRDLHGDKDKKHAETETPDELVEEMEKELLHIPADCKSHYMEAMSKCPDVVASESNRMQFLRYEDYRPEAAARHLVEYWRYRNSVFGSELAYLPLSKTGALREDCEVLSAGVWSELPDDSEGRAVLYYDRAKGDAVVKKDGIHRVMFYSVNQLLQRESAQKNGIVMVIDVRSMYDIKSFDRKLDRRKVDLFINALPVRIRALHVCCTGHRSILDFICPMFKKMVGKDLRHRMVLHNGDPEDIVASLEDYGLSSNILPDQLGGTFVMEEPDGSSG